MSIAWRRELELQAPAMGGAEATRHVEGEGEGGL